VTYLDIRTCLLTVERALVDALSLGYQMRLPAVANLAALAALPSFGPGVGIPPRALRFVTAEGVVYRWQKDSSNAALSPLVVLPSDRPATSPGRWERQRSTVTMGPNHNAPVHRVATGYAKTVRLWQGDEGEMLERIFGQSPALLVRLMGWPLTLKGSPAGGIYEANLPVQIWCFSRCYRPDQEALEGSGVAAEAAADPGLLRMFGDVRYLLAGTDLGLGPGVRYVDIQGDAQIHTEDLGERAFVGIVPITVRASFNIPDEDLVPLSEITIQHQDAGLPPDGVADLQNYLVQGGRIPPGAGLSGSPGPFAAYVAGRLVAVSPGVNLFAANADTYRDLTTSGALIYTPVAVDGEPPAQLPETLRLGFTRTDASDIVNDTLLCGYALDVGERYSV